MLSRRSSSRKRNASSGRSRQGNQRKRTTVVTLAILGLLSAIAVYLWRSHPQPSPASKTLSKSERQRIAARVRTWVERAGGDDVWVKVPASAESFETVIAQAKFDAVVSSVDAAAVVDELRVKRKMLSEHGGHRRLELIFEQGPVEAGRWILREVPRIGRAAIIIDDLGQDPHSASELARLSYPLTFAVLPHLPHSAQAADEAHRVGREVMLHLPMQAESSANPGPGELRPGQSGAEVKQIISGDLASVPHVAGVNNHMGSRATMSTELMGTVMKVLAEKRLYFIDSRTTGGSVALQAARREGIPTFFRSVFLDDEESVAYTVGKLRELERVATEKGAAVAIGHPHPTTIAALERTLPEFERQDIQLVAVSRLLRLAVIGTLEPAPVQGRVELEARQ